MTLFAINVRRTKTTEEMAVVHIEALNRHLAMAQIDFLDPQEFDWLTVEKDHTGEAKIQTVYVDGAPVWEASNEDDYGTK
jgi:hypothetical protein